MNKNASYQNHQPVTKFGFSRSILVPKVYRNFKTYFLLKMFELKNFYQLHFFDNFVKRCAKIKVKSWSVLKYVLLVVRMSHLQDLKCQLSTKIHWRWKCLGWHIITMFNTFKMVLGEVEVWLPWWCHILVLPAPGNWWLFLNHIFFLHNEKMTSFRRVLAF